MESASGLAWGRDMGSIPGTQGGNARTRYSAGGVGAGAEQRNIGVVHQGMGRDAAVRCGRPPVSTLPPFLSPTPSTSLSLMVAYLVCIQVCCGF